MTADKPAVVPKALQDFDRSLLPKKPLLDTGIWLRAFGWETDDDAARVKRCRDLVEALEAVDARMLMAAPSLAEMLRRDPDRKAPRRKSIAVVGFDQKAAEELQRVIAPWKNDGTGNGPALKFDPMIVACAQRWGADCIVALDERLKNSAPRATVKFKKPTDFLLPLLGEIEAKRDAETKAGSS